MYDASPLIEQPVCEPLKRLPFFMTARARGTVAWDDDLDVAPERLYEEAVRS